MLSVGYMYYEGYLRVLSNKGAEVLASGRRCRLLIVAAVVSINMIAVDVKEASDADVSDKLVLFGPDGERNRSRGDH